MDLHRRDALREYFIAIVRDLLARGVIRQKGGQTLDEILRSEMATVLGEIHGDLATVAAELLGAGSAAVAGLLQRRIEGFVNVGLRAFGEALGRKVGGR